MYRTPASGRATCGRCDTNVPVEKTVYTRDGVLVCLACAATPDKTRPEPSPAVTAPQPPRYVRGDWLRGLLAPPCLLPVAWLVSRILQVALPRTSDPEVAGPVLAAAAWFFATVTIAVLAFVRWRRPRVALGVLVALGATVVVAGLLALAFAMALRGAIRG